MNAFGELALMPGLRSLLVLGWRLFGVNPALVSADGQRVVVFEKDSCSQPFCAALERNAAGLALCAMCDQSRSLEARQDLVKAGICSGPLRALGGWKRLTQPQ